MPNDLEYPEINCPGAYERYNGKGVLFRAQRGSRTHVWKGTFRVAPNEKYILIDVVVEGAPNSIVHALI
jgi:hypothetical protein